MKAFKQIIVLFWVAIYLTTPFFNAFVMADYAVRYTYYKEVLCENKDKPTLLCNGKCMVVKNLQASTTSSEPSLPSIIDYRIVAVEQDLHVGIEGHSASVLSLVYALFIQEKTLDIYLNFQEPPPKFC